LRLMVCQLMAYHSAASSETAPTACAVKSTLWLRSPASFRESVERRQWKVCRHRMSSRVKCEQLQNAWISTGTVSFELVGTAHAEFGAALSGNWFTEGAKRVCPRRVLEVESHR
jgi:hypothetical protein